MFYLPLFNTILASGALVMLLGAGVLYVDYFVYKRKHFTSLLQPFLWPLLLLLTISGVCISLIYSEYFGLLPCSLCWVQRIALYPQALLVVVAYVLKDKKYFPVYGLWLSVFGLLVSIYHYIHQNLPKDSSAAGFTPCLADGSSADCADKIMNVFGFITFPFVSAATFLLLIALYLYLRRHKEDV